MYIYTDIQIYNIHIYICIFDIDNTGDSVDNLYKIIEAINFVQEISPIHEKFFCFFPLFSLQFR